MKSKYVLPLFIAAALFLLTIQFSLVYAATCSGTACNGLSPNSTGCDQSAVPVSATTSNGAYIELRKSTECSTYWARTKNVSGSSKYTNATLKYYYYTASPAPIANGLAVYSPQRYSTSSSGMAACGMVSSSPVGAMVYSPCVP